MVRPADFPTYATNANYTTGPHNGTPTKIAMVSGDTQNGNISGIFPSSRKFNWWQNLVGQWIVQFAAELDILNATTASASYIIWRPGEPSPAGNVYASFTDAVTAALAINVPNPWIWVDNSLTASPNMPLSAVSGGGRCVLASATNVTLNFGDNSQLTNWRAIIATAPAFITINISSATGSSIVTNGSGAVLYLENCRQTLSAGSRVWASAANLAAHNCRIENMAASTLRVSGSLTTWGPVPMNTVSTLSIEDPKVYWRPGSETSGPTFSEPTLRTRAMVTAWLSGLSSDNKTVQNLVLDCLYSSGVHTIATSTLDLGSRVNLDVINASRVTVDAVQINNPYEYIDFHEAEFAIANITSAIVLTAPSAVGDAECSIRNTKAFGDFVGSSTTYLVSLADAWNAGRKKVVNLVNCRQRTQSNCRYVRVSSTITLAGTFTVNVFGEKLVAQATNSGYLVTYGGSATATIANLVVNWFSPAPIRYERLFTGWSSTGGTSKVFDKWNVRLPKSFPVIHNNSSSNTWNFRELWPDMPDGYYYVRVTQSAPSAGARVISMEFGMGVTSQVVDAIVFTDNGTSSSIYQPRKVAVDDGKGDSHVTISSGNLAIVNIGSAYSGSGATLTIIGSTIDGM